MTEAIVLPLAHSSWSDGLFYFVKELLATYLDPELARYRFGTSRLVEWRGIDGEALRGALLLPSDYREGRRYPLIVNTYGGARLSGDVNRFGAGYGDENLQLLATRGYAVLLPDTPVHPGRFARDLFKAVMPGIEKIVELGSPTGAPGGDGAQLRRLQRGGLDQADDPLPGRRHQRRDL